MADERRIVFVIKKEGASSASSGSSAGTLGSGTQEPEKTSTGAEGNNSSVAGALAAFAAKNLVETAASEAYAWGMYEWDKSLALADDYIGQRNKQVAMQMISKASSSISNVLGSAASGAIIGGPLGAAFGAAVGAVKVVSSTARENIQGKEQQEIHLATMQKNLDYTRKRSGWSTEAASIGEDL